MIGKIVDADTGTLPSTPVQLKSRMLGSKARVYYLSEDGTTLKQGVSTCSGIFVIFSASPAEKFDAYREGVQVSSHEATVGTSYGGAYATSVQVDKDGQ